MKSKTLVRTHIRPHCGAAAIILVLTLCSLALAFMVLASKTNRKMQNIEHDYLEYQQCNELLEFGSITLRKKLNENENYQGESIELALPTPSQSSDMKSSLTGEILIEPIDTPQSPKAWRIQASYGWKGGVREQATQLLDLNTNRDQGTTK